MPEKCRVGVCGFDPMLVKAYAAANMRACRQHESLLVAHTRCAFRGI
jgi:hypothetical protein